MIRLIYFVFVASISLPSIVFSAQELSTATNEGCNPETSSWTPWFNTQDPSKTGGNDVEDISRIRVSYPEAARCNVVSNIEYSLSSKGNNGTFFYQTMINNNGVFCMGSASSPCPDYSVRFCCPREEKPSSLQCGVTSRQPFVNYNLRIVNGREAVPHSWPWAVSLQYRGQHDCGGVIIDQWHILTAAHCLDYSDDLPNYIARVGAHDRMTSGQAMPIAELIIHPNYDEMRSSDDIGIIRLASPITFNTNIQPICLFDDASEPPLDSTVYVAGWGNTAHQVWDSSSPVLLQAQLRVVSDCSMYFAYDARSQICTAHNGPADRDHGSCQGDSGGGLFYYKNGRWHAAGVVSYAIGCGQKAYPTVFTKIALYSNWIRNIVDRKV